MTLQLNTKLRSALLALSLLFAPLGAHAIGEENNRKSQWLLAFGPVKAVALVVHGMNLDPCKMNPIANFLQAQGVEVLRATLFGHENLDDMSMVNYSIWRNEMTRFYQEARARADQQKVPLYYIGYSLGGLLHVDFLSHINPRKSYQKAVLFAPAIALNDYLYAGQLITGFQDWVLTPTFTPASYAAFPYVSVGVYRAIYQLAEKIEQGLPLSVNIPTMVIIDPFDELVSLRAIENLITADHLTHWSIVKINNTSSTLSEPAHHLIIDEKALGIDEWHRVLLNIKQYLGL